MAEGDQLGRVCSAVLGLTGAFEESAPQPSDVFGCWPVGTWTFTARVEDNECTEDPALENEYRFLVERDEESVETYTYLTDPAYERVRIKVTSGGGGLCEGGLELYSEDGTKVLNLKPALHADKTITGFGEYDLYLRDQWDRD
jgi:hypothetical protein